MKKITVSILLFLFVYTIQAQTETIPITKWRKNFEGAKITDLVIDASENVYTIGYFNNTVDFDPGDGVFNLTSVNGSRDVFICKYDVSGNLLWAQQIGGELYEEALNLQIDSFGDIYILGLFQSFDMDFDTATGESILSGGGSLSSTFILKLNNEGNFKWVKSWAFTWASKLSLDFDGNLYLLGEYLDSKNFDENTNTHTLTTLGNSDLCILKMNPYGDVLWVKGFNSSSFETYTYSSYAKLQFDRNNNIYLVGYIGFNNTVDLDWGPNEFNVSTTTDFKTFIVKLTPDGDFIRANVSDFHGNVMAVKVDQYQNCYLMGSFNISFDMNFEGVPQSLNTNGAINNLYILKANDLGKVVWFKTLNGVYGANYDIDKSGGVYITGIYSNTVDFGLDGTPENFTASDPINGDQFVVTYSNGGSLNWFKTIERNIYDALIKVDSISGSVFLAGYTVENMLGYSAIEKVVLCNLPQAPASSNKSACIGNELTLNASGEGALGWYTDAIGGRHVGTGSDFSTTVLKDTVFYVQDSTCYASASRTSVSVYVEECVATNILKGGDLMNVKVYPNPTSSKLFIESVHAIDKILVTDLMGRILLETNAVNSIDISDLSNGIYYITIINDSKANTQKVIKY